jgi:hypothetical protein
VPRPRALLLALAVHGCASSGDHFQRPGLAVFGGAGHQTPDLGVGAHYYFGRPGRPLQLAPRVGVGVMVRPTGNAAGISAGLSGIYGYRHRLVGDAGFGSLGLETLSLHGTKVDSHVVHGPTAAVGYEYVAGGGFLLRYLLGAGYEVGPVASRTRLIGIGTIECGHKF